MNRNLFARGKNILMAKVTNFKPVGNNDYSFRLVREFNGSNIEIYAPDGNVVWTLNKYASDGTIEILAECVSCKSEYIPWPRELCKICEQKAIRTAKKNFVEMEGVSIGEFENPSSRYSSAAKTKQKDIIPPLCPKCKTHFLRGEEKICQSCVMEEAIEEKKKFFSSRIKLKDDPFLLDSEQTAAILNDNDTQVVARAGSGKTRVLTAKLIDLFVNYGVKENEVLAFCFNRDAADEIRKRLNSDCTVDDKTQHEEFNVVFTFHAYARQILNPESKILVDEKENNNARTRLVKKIISHLRATDTKFEEKLRDYFISDTLKIDRKKFKSDEHYYRFIRGCRYRTLNGESVRSIPEKYIADFLFEHGIEYKYEFNFNLKNTIDWDNSHLSAEEREEYDSVYDGKSATVPDFYLPKFSVIWEHWGITGRENSEQQSEFSKSVGSYEKYQKSQTWKRNFWNKWRFKLNVKRYDSKNFKSVKLLIETSTLDISSDTDRELAERKIKAFLERNGIKCERRPDKELIDLVWRKAQDNFTRLITQFIDKYQQRFIGRHKSFEALAKECASEKEIAFLELGYKVYKKYHEVLSGKFEGFEDFSEYRIDFNQCLFKATKLIEQGEYDENILALKWILIDEYQDFSELFYALINAIRKRNPEIKVFCVGDDWQAINRFAGSDLKFFLEFASYFPKSKKFNIRTNYRCEKHIVTNAGKHMERFNIPGAAQVGFLSNTGEVQEIPLESVFSKELEEYSWLFEEEKYWGNSNTSESDVKAYVKICSDIVNANPGKSVMILNRTHSFCGEDITTLGAAIKDYRVCKIQEPKVVAKTVHSAKGEESDIVILTEVNQGTFPMFHPDTYLFEVFGESAATTMEDETRLYYVALTRAKHSLYIIFKRNAPSCFINDPYIKNDLTSSKNKKSNLADLI